MHNGVSFEAAHEINSQNLSHNFQSFVILNKILFHIRRAGETNFFPKQDVKRKVFLLNYS